MTTRRKKIKTTIYLDPDIEKTLADFAARRDQSQGHRLSPHGQRHQHQHRGDAGADGGHLRPGQHGITQRRQRPGQQGGQGQAQPAVIGAGEIAQAADDLSRRTEQQAASLEETAAALDQITATVNKTASGARQASDRSRPAQSDARSACRTPRR